MRISKKLVSFVTAIALLVSMFTGIPATPASAAIDDPVVWYKFDAASGTTVVDSSGNGKDATLEGEASWIKGKHGNAANLDGADDYVNLPDGIVSSLTDFTISTWIKIGELRDWSRVFDFGSSSAWMFMTTVGGKLRYQIYRSGTGDDIVESTTLMDINRWYHIIVTQSGTTCKLYIDGVQVAEKTNMRLNPSNCGVTNKNYIGKSRFSADKNLPAQVDDLRIYNHALSAEEVNTLANLPPEIFSIEAVNVITTEGVKPELPDVVTAVYDDDSTAEVAVTWPEIESSQYADEGTFTVEGAVYGTEIKAIANVTVVADQPDVIAWYKFDSQNGTTISDMSGHGKDATLVGGASLAAGIFDNAVKFDGVDGYVRLPEGILSSADEATISTWVKLDESRQFQRIFDFGGDGNYTTFMFLTPKAPDGIRLRFAANGVDTRVLTGAGDELAVGEWKHIAIVISNNTGVMYIDGVEVARNNALNHKPSDLGATIYNYIGKSTLNPADPYLKGLIDDFKIYNRGLDQTEIAALYEQAYPGMVEEAKNALDLGDTSVVATDLTLPTEGINGTTITWESSNPAVVAVDGTVTRPAKGSETATVTLTATIKKGNVEAKKEFIVVVPATNDESDVLLDKNALSLGLTTAVISNLILPTAGRYGTTITWETSDPSVLEANGTVHRPAKGTGNKLVTLTATIRKGDVQDTKVFPLTVIEEYAAYIKAYIREGGTYADDSLHLAYSYDGVDWIPLNNNYGILFPKAGTTHMRDPFLFRKQDGKFALLASNKTNSQGSPDIYVWESSNLINYENEHLLRVNSTKMSASAPVCTYDAVKGQYVIYWTGDAVYSNTTTDFVAVSAPVKFSDANYPVVNNILEVTQEELDTLIAKMGPAPTITSAKELAVKTQTGKAPVLPSEVEVTFSDGTTGKVGVEWDTVTSDQYATPGSFTVEGILKSKYPNPLIENRADPHVFKHTDGYYYFTGSVPEYDRIILRRAKTIEGLATAEEKVIWRKHDSGEMSQHIWAPEIHYIDGKWYIYFAASKADNIWAIRQYALECADADPMTGIWTEKGKITMNFEEFTLDATTFEHKGERYLAWAQKVSGISNIYIAKMKNPWTISGTQVLIATPEYGWETQLYSVCEGPQVIKRNGKIFITYSASGTDHRYCLGLLTASEDSDLLDPKSWVKTPYPIFMSNPEASEYGPGHNGFAVEEDGSDVLVYHARPYKDIVGDPLYDINRHTRVQRMFWHGDGSPNLVVPGYKFDTPIKAKVTVTVEGDTAPVGDGYTITPSFNLSKLEAGRMLNASVDVTNNGTQQGPVLMMVALYDSRDAMINISFISKEILEGKTEHLNAGFKLPENVSGHKVRVFVWDGKDLQTTNMQPLSNVVELQ